MPAPDAPTGLPAGALAVVGMAGRFPGARNLTEFWNNLCAGREGVRFFSAEELDPSIPATLRADPAYVRAKGLLEDSDKFDAAFFGIPPLEAQVMDPQHRILLELAWAVLEDAGHPAADFPGLIGVYAGANWNRYRSVCVAARPEVVARFGELATALANEGEFLATRISYKLNLRGPSVTVGTACSTSLVAIAQAAQALLNRDCDLALAGGVSITVPLHGGYLHQEGGMLSADGHTRCFDARCSGTTFNDGAGLVALRRLEDAVADGDRIYAVIRGFAVNNDGSDKLSFTAPSLSGQVSVIRAAWEHAGEAPASAGLIEAHGTATPLGDPIEVAALKRVFAGAAPGSCALGSVKSGIGHLVHAAGVAGFIKAALAVRHGKIPPTLFFEQPNPRLGLENSPFRVPVALEDWPAADHPRRAGVSSFGVGGTNAHVVLEEPPRPVEAPAAPEPQILCLSARDEEALQRQISDLQTWLQAAPADVRLDAIAATLRHGRAALPQRAAWAVRSREDAASALADRRRAARGTADAQPALAFQFPGQGAQKAGMGRALYEESALFRQHFDAGAELLKTATGQDLRALLFGSGALGEGELEQTGIAQPALFVLEYALAQVLESQGLRPAAYLGHSLGEFTAAACAGVMSFADALQVVAARGAAMQSLPRGSMLAARCSEEQARTFLTSEIALAAVNAPEICVLSGPHAAIDRLAAALAQQGIGGKRLRTSHAFHSAMMDPAVAALRPHLQRVALAPPQRTIVSTVTGRLLSTTEATDPEYWVKQLREPVRFADALECLAGLGPQILIEVGPGGTLSALALQHPQATSWTAVSALPGAGLTSGAELELLSAVAQTWASGGMVAHPRLRNLPGTGLVSLPTYPFARTRYWLDPPPLAGAGNSGTMPEPAYNPATAVPAASTLISARTVSLRERVLQVIEETTGADMSGAPADAPFAELGLDSLALTQISLQIQRRLQVKVSFRQLMEDCSTLGRLEAFLQRAEAGAAAATSVPAAAHLAPAQVSDEAEAPSGIVKYDVKKAFGAIVRIHTGTSADLSERQRMRLGIFLRRYQARTPKSKEYTRAHRAHLADPRVVNGFRPLLKEIIYQLVIERSQGSKVWDLDGNEYVDVLSGFGMNLFGWQPAFVQEAVRRQLEEGYEIGPQHPLAGEVARLICELTGHERAGLCNTGSEAVMGALRVARTVTGRSTIALFSGSYHGIFDEVIVRGNRKLRAFPAAPGIMPNTAENVLVLDYGTPEALEILRARGHELAAVLVEPVQSRRPDLQPKEFLRELRAITTATGALLILDEVVTGFRCHPGGIQALFDVRADLCTYGKVVGGGFPIGVIAGQRAFMDALDGGGWEYGDASVPTVGVTYFAGTFVRHPLALAAAKAVLEHLQAAGPELQAGLTQRTAAFAAELNAFFAEVGAPLEIKHFASVWKTFFTEDHPLQDLLFAMLRSRGVHILDNFPCFFTTAHSAADLRQVTAAFKAAVAEMQESEFLPRRRDAAAGALDAAQPPAPGARIGKDPDGTPAWYVPDPSRPGKYVRYSG